MIGIVEDGRKENASIILQNGLMDIKLAIMVMAQPARYANDATRIIVTLFFVKSNREMTIKSIQYVD
jgi:hypothetical protein